MLEIHSACAAHGTCSVVQSVWQHAPPMRRAAGPVPSRPPRTVHVSCVGSQRQPESVSLDVLKSTSNQALSFAKRMYPRGSVTTCECGNTNHLLQPPPIEYYLDNVCPRGIAGVLCFYRFCNRTETDGSGRLSTW
eukprot:m.425243 g.425243  ORF g.425243 m.425243 type:complete len:135 (-) comp21344_c0_seq1:141-545(-)